jgi:hypothetical protein
MKVADVGRLVAAGAIQTGGIGRRMRDVKRRMIVDALRLVAVHARGGDTLGDDGLVVTRRATLEMDLGDIRIRVMTGLT